MSRANNRGFIDIDDYGGIHLVKSDNKAGLRALTVAAKTASAIGGVLKVPGQVRPTGPRGGGQFTRPRSVALKSDFGEQGHKP